MQKFVHVCIQDLEKVYFLMLQGEITHRIQGTTIMSRNTLLINSRWKTFIFSGGLNLEFENEFRFDSSRITHGIPKENHDDDDDDDDDEVEKTNANDIVKPIAPISNVIEREAITKYNEQVSSPLWLTDGLILKYLEFNQSNIMVEDQENGEISDEEDEDEEEKDDDHHTQSKTFCKSMKFVQNNTRRCKSLRLSVQKNFNPLY